MIARRWCMLASCCAELVVSTFGKLHFSGQRANQPLNYCETSPQLLVEEGFPNLDASPCTTNDQNLCIKQKKFTRRQGDKRTREQEKKWVGQNHEHKQRSFCLSCICLSPALLSPCSFDLLRFNCAVTNDCDQIATQTPNATTEGEVVLCRKHHAAFQGGKNTTSQIFRKNRRRWSQRARMLKRMAMKACSATG